jgi:hypothetical protein
MNRPGSASARTSEDDRNLLAGQSSELERLRLQSLVWKPSGRRLAGMARGAAPAPGRWLRRSGLVAGAERVGRSRRNVTGTDIDESMLDQGATPERQPGEGRPLRQRARADSFGLVHAGFELGPLRRGHAQMGRVR